MSFLSNIIAGAVTSAASTAINNHITTKAASQAPYRVLRDGAETLYHNETFPADQRIFGVPAASLNFASNLNENAVEAGIKGEQRVAAKLDHYAATHPNVYVFHSVKIPGQVGDVDHVVVSGNTVVLIDSKNWRKDSSYMLFAGASAEADYVQRDEQDFDGGEIHLNRQKTQWAASLPSGYQLKAVLVIANEESFTNFASAVDYDFVNLLGLENALNRALPSTAQPLHSAEVHRFASRAQNPNFDPADENNYVWVYPTSGKAQRSTNKTTWWFMVWSILNYVLLPFTYPVSAISALVLIFCTHKHLNTNKKNGNGGVVINTLTLVFSYLLLFVWMFFFALFLITLSLQ